MAYMGVGYSGYEYETCPLCGQGMWNGRCENPDCEYHWNPKDDNCRQLKMMKKARKICEKKICESWRGTVRDFAKDVENLQQSQVQ